MWVYSSWCGRCGGQIRVGKRSQQACHEAQGGGQATSQISWWGWYFYGGTYIMQYAVDNRKHDSFTATCCDFKTLLSSLLSRKATAVTLYVQKQTNAEDGHVSVSLWKLCIVISHLKIVSQGIQHSRKLETVTGSSLQWQLSSLMST